MFRCRYRKFDVADDRHLRSEVTQALVGKYQEVPPQKVQLDRRRRASLTSAAHFSLKDLTHSLTFSKLILGNGGG